MPIFRYQFTVDAPLQVVSAFHYDTSALKKLNPPGIFVQLHDIEPMEEGSVSEFSLWFGPFPVRWKAVHSQVSDRGFVDEMAAGPAKRWRHTHTFVPLSDRLTRIEEHIDFEYKSGIAGLGPRLLFAKPNLWLLFTWRKLSTRYHINRIMAG